MVISGMKKKHGVRFSVLLSGTFPADYKWKTVCTVLSYTCFEFEWSENNENSMNHPKTSWLNSDHTSSSYWFYMHYMLPTTPMR